MDVTTTFREVLPTEVIYEQDTLVLYRTEYRDRYIEVETAATLDSTRLSIKVKNELDLFHVRERTPLFGAPRYRVTARITNPYSDVEQLESVLIHPPQRRLGVGLFGGYGMTSEGQVGPVVGVGVTYRIF